MNPETAAICKQCGADLDEPVGSDYVERLIHALDHPEPNTRALAATLLGKIGDERGLRALCEKAKTNDDMTLLEAVAEALGNFPSLEAVETLKKLAESQWLTVREKAKASLCRISDAD